MELFFAVSYLPVMLVSYLPVMINESPSIPNEPAMIYRY